MKMHSYKCHKNILENGKLVKAGFCYKSRTCFVEAM